MKIFVVVHKNRSRKEYGSAAQAFEAERVPPRYGVVEPHEYPRVMIQDEFGLYGPVLRP
jgi:hypothetical protein